MSDEELEAMLASLEHRPATGEGDYTPVMVAILRRLKASLEREAVEKQAAQELALRAIRVNLETQRMIQDLMGTKREPKARQPRQEPEKERP